MVNIQEYWKNIMRLLHVAAKPGKDEYWMSVKVTGIGIAVMGAIGYALFVIFTFIKAAGIF